jgi:hypothetical protein
MRQLYEESPENVFHPSRSQKTVLAIVVLLGGASLVYSPIPWLVALKFIAIGAIGGVFWLPRDQAAALVGMFFVLVGVNVLSKSLEKSSPALHMAFWQPAALSFAAFVCCYFILTLGVRYFTARRPVN